MAFSGFVIHTMYNLKIARSYASVPEFVVVYLMLQKICRSISQIHLVKIRVLLNYFATFRKSAYTLLRYRAFRLFSFFCRTCIYQNNKNFCNGLKINNLRFFTNKFITPTNSFLSHRFTATFCVNMNMDVCTFLYECG